MVIALPVLTLLAGLFSLYVAHKQLTEARKIRRENQTFIENQMKEDDLRAEGYVAAGKLLCKIASRVVVGNTQYTRGALSLVFPDLDVRNHILSHLIEQQDIHNFAMRPFDLAQLRLKPTRDLIDVVLATIEKFKRERPEEANQLGLLPE